VSAWEDISAEETDLREAMAEMLPEKARTTQCEQECYMAVSSWLLDWLQRDTHRCLLLDCHSADEIADPLIPKHQSQFKECLERGALLHKKQWLQDAQWADILSQIHL